MSDRLHTSCKDCIFAIYDKNVQVGCDFNRLEKLKKNNIEIIESYDEEKEFYVLHKHACMSYRENDFLINKTYDEAKKITRNQMSPRIAAVINITSNDLEKTKITIKSLSEQEIQFSEVIFCISSKVKPSEIMAIIKDLNCKFRWNIKEILDDYWTGARAINISVQKSRSTYFSIFYDGFIIPKTFVKEIDTAICDEMKRFIILEPIDSTGNCSTFQTYAFNALRGNEEASVEDESNIQANTFFEKITYIATKQGLMHLIKKCEDICPCTKNQN